MKRNIFVLLFAMVLAFVFSFAFVGCKQAEQAVEEKKEEAVNAVEKMEQKAGDVIEQGKTEMKKGAEALKK
jgi:hypothetical protein